MDNFRFNLILSTDEGDTLLTLTFPRHRTIGHLKRFIENVMKMEGLRGDIYFLFDRDCRDMKEEYLLGGVLMPEDVPLLESIIDNHATFFADCQIIENQAEEADEANEANEAMNNDIVNYLSNSLAQSLNTINSLSLLTNLVEPNLETFANQATNMSSLDSLINRMNPQTQIFGAGTISITTEPLLDPLIPMNPLANMMNLFSTLRPQQPAMEDVVVGIHKSDLDALRINLHKNFDNKELCDTCAICIENFKEDDVCRELKCHHLFHKDCVDHWLETSVKCPVCRNETGRGVPKF
jgi:hypothetical protein